MPFGIRKRLPILPGIFWGNASKSGLSWSFRIWPLGWNSRRGWSLDLPGPLYWRQRRKRRPR